MIALDRGKVSAGELPLKRGTGYLWTERSWEEIPGRRNEELYLGIGFSLESAGPNSLIVLGGFSCGSCGCEAGAPDVETLHREFKLQDACTECLVAPSKGNGIWTSGVLSYTCGLVHLWMQYTVLNYKSGCKISLVADGLVRLQGRNSLLLYFIDL